jgi:hypothetical protein
MTPKEMEYRIKRLEQFMLTVILDQNPDYLVCLNAAHARDHPVPYYNDIPTLDWDKPVIYIIKKGEEE